MFWCSLVGADRPPKQAMPVARKEDLGLCVLWCLISAATHIVRSTLVYPLTLVPFCDHVPDWQPRVLLGMVEARSVNVKNTTTYNNAAKKWHSMFRTERVDVLVFLGGADRPPHTAITCLEQEDLSFGVLCWYVFCWERKVIRAERIADGRVPLLARSGYISDNRGIILGKSRRGRVKKWASTNQLCPFHAVNK